MQLCITHFAELKTALLLRGLWEYQTQTTEDSEKLVRQINGDEGEDEATTFDCLLMAQMMIFDQALEIAGDSIMELNDAGQSLCPLCEMTLHPKIKSKKWIVTACDNVLQAAKEYGIMKPETRQ